MKLFDHTVMAHSDTEEVYETTDTGLKQLNLTDALGDTETYEKTIHSGHFMISHVHDDSISETAKHLDDEMVSKDESTDCVYESGRASSIDPSFTQLFQCMSIVEKYFSTSGKLTSPKWKNFKGIKFRLKEKIRVNNLIWREWHMQYVKYRTPVLCHFSPPLAVQSDGHSSAVDGMCWKRNLKVLINEYKKWRHYFNKKLVGKNNVRDVLSSNSPYCEILQRTSENNSKRLTNLGGIVKKSHHQNPPSQLLMDDDIFNDLPFMSGWSIEGSNLRDVPAFSDENFGDMIADGYLNDMDTLESSIFRCESLNFNKAYSTPSVQSSTMLDNVNVQGRHAGLESLGMLNVDAAILNLPLDLATAGSLDDGNNKTMDFQMSEHLMSLLVSQQQTLGHEANLSNAPVATSFQDVPVQIETGHRLKGDFVIDGLFGQSAVPSFNIEVQPSSNIILSNQEAENIVGVLYTTNNNGNNSNNNCNNNNNSNNANDFQLHAGSKSMPLLSGLLQQPKQPMIIHLPPGYQLVASQDMSQDGARIENGNFINLGHNFGNVQVQVQSKVAVPPSQAESRSLSSLQVLRNAKDSRCRGNLSAGSLSKLSAGFRIPQHQVKCRQKASSTVSIQPRPQKCSIPSMQQSTVKRLLLPSNTSSSRPQLPDPHASDQFGNSLENGPVCISMMGGSSSNTKSEKRRRVRNEKVPPPAALLARKNDQPKSNNFSAIFQPINPLINSLEQPQSHTIASFKVNDLYGAADSQMDHDDDVSKYSLENSLGFNDVSRLFKLPDRSRHASNDSGSSHCEETFSLGPKKFVSKDLRRISHLTSEQKRRFSIKCGLDTLNELVPGLDSNSGSRISKATTLHKAAEFCKKLKAEKQLILEEIDRARNEVKCNDLAIKNAHSKMPVQGLPSTGSRNQANQMKAWFQKFILQRSHDNWKYWIFGTIIETLFNSFEEVVTTSSVVEFRQSILRWLTDHCSLIVLRPIVSNSLRKLSTSTCILVDPDGFRNQVVVKINSAMTQNSIHL